jgi:hypothetical protein
VFNSVQDSDFNGCMIVPCFLYFTSLSFPYARRENPHNRVCLCVQWVEEIATAAVFSRLPYAGIYGPVDRDVHLIYSHHTDDSPSFTRTLQYAIQTEDPTLGHWISDPIKNGNWGFLHNISVYSLKMSQSTMCNCV